MRNHLHRSELVRLLAGCLPPGSTASAMADTGRQDVAERLGQWLNVVDAIALRSAHGAIAAAGQQAQRASPPSGAATHQQVAHQQVAHQQAARQQAARLQAELARVRTQLTQSINTRHTRHPPDPADLDTEFVLGLQRYQEEQRRMELSVDALREHIRQTLARGTPQQAQLAALDAALAQVLGGREQRLLNQVPTFLKARWAALRRSAAEATAEAGAEATGTPAPSGTAGPPPQPDPSASLRLLHTFNTELEHTLLAELEHRLLPLTGLIESLAP